MQTTTPVALFAYNRAGHAQRALSALERCDGLRGCPVYLYSDGPRSPDAVEAVEATRKVLRSWASRLGAEVIERPANLGLARSIVTGVSELCRHHGRVIVLEDDLEVRPDFLRFMIGALDHYEAVPEVMQVGGLPLCPPVELATDAFVLPVTTTWGWGTWHRAWQSFSWEPRDLELARRDCVWSDRFNLNGAGAYSAMLDDRLAGRNDSWGILWWYAVSRAGGLVVYPALPLVRNAGFDGSGTHCGSTDVFAQQSVTDHAPLRLPAKLRFPAPGEFNPAHLARLESYLRTLAGPTPAAANNGQVAMTTRRLLEKLRHALS